LLLG
jgi:hypothetical protein